MRAHDYQAVLGPLDSNPLICSREVCSDECHEIASRMTLRESPKRNVQATLMHVGFIGFISCLHLNPVGWTGLDSVMYLRMSPAVFPPNVVFGPQCFQHFSTSELDPFGYPFRD